MVVTAPHDPLTSHASVSYADEGERTGVYTTAEPYPLTIMLDHLA